MGIVVVFQEEPDAKGVLFEGLGWVVEVLMGWIVQNFINNGWGGEVLKGAWCDGRILVGFA